MFLAPINENSNQISIYEMCDNVSWVTQKHNYAVITTKRCYQRYRLEFACDIFDIQKHVESTWVSQECVISTLILTFTWSITRSKTLLSALSLLQGLTFYKIIIRVLNIFYKNRKQSQNNGGIILGKFINADSVRVVIQW